ncbi:hypothetical protein BV25DRAFT_1910685 [Artomyces pyxidatus]|uniref:Uncharacterized protein n=1 Tax=Artomyces pyxidatus TaxID=48021 RepID=A0ACB8TKJ8_9AGAM|nr:hypothetical protein BV25DRAFT_1910685 [Artomyces pyxidatus]
MFISAAVAFLLGSSVTFAGPLAENSTITVRKCGTTISDERLIAAEEYFALHKVTPFFDPFATATVNVYYHVISEDDTLAGGNVGDDLIAAQISALNDGYSGSGLTFTLAGTDRTVNSDWFNTVGPDSDEQTDMKTSLRQGGAADLNLYSVGFKSGSGSGLLGYSTFPWDYESDPQDDGVVFLFSSVPNGGTTNYEQGKVSACRHL